MKTRPLDVGSPIVMAGLAGAVVIGLLASLTSGGACLILLAFGGVGLARLVRRRWLQILIPPDEVKQTIADALLVAVGHRRDAR